MQKSFCKYFFGILVLHWYKKVGIFLLWLLNLLHEPALEAYSRAGSCSCSRSTNQRAIITKMAALLFTLKISIWLLLVIKLQESWVFMHIIWNFVSLYHQNWEKLAVLVLLPFVVIFQYQLFLIGCRVHSWINFMSRGLQISQFAKVWIDWCVVSCKISEE